MKSHPKADATIQRTTTVQDGKNQFRLDVLEPRGIALLCDDLDAQLDALARNNVYESALDRVSDLRSTLADFRGQLLELRNVIRGASEERSRAIETAAESRRSR